MLHARRMRLGALVGCLWLLAGCARAPIAVPQPQNERRTQAAQPAATQAEAILSATALPLTVGDGTLTLPLLPAQAAEAGFVPEALLEGTLDPYAMSAPVTLSGHGARFTVYLYNPGDAPAPYADCPIVWAVLVSEAGQPRIIAPGGAVLGESLRSDIEALCGEADEVVGGADQPLVSLRYGMGMDSILYLLLDPQTTQLEQIEIIAFPAGEVTAP